MTELWCLHYSNSVIEKKKQEREKGSVYITLINQSISNKTGTKRSYCNRINHSTVPNFNPKFETPRDETKRD